jgi:phage terminase small subunit
MPKGRKKADSLSPRKAQFVKGVVAGKSARQAALDAGYSQSVANDPGRKLFNQSAKMGGYMPKDTPDLVVPIQVVIDL